MVAEVACELECEVIYSERRTVRGFRFGFSHVASFSFTNGLISNHAECHSLSHLYLLLLKDRFRKRIFLVVGWRKIEHRYIAQGYFERRIFRAFDFSIFDAPRSRARTVKLVLR